MSDFYQMCKSLSFSLLVALVGAVSAGAAEEVKLEAESFPITARDWPKPLKGKLSIVKELFEYGSYHEKAVLKMGKDSFRMPSLPDWNLKRASAPAFSMQYVLATNSRTKMGFAVRPERTGLIKIETDALTKYIKQLQNRYGKRLEVKSAEIVRPEDTVYSSDRQTFVEVSLLLSHPNHPRKVAERQIFYYSEGYFFAFVISGDPVGVEKHVKSFREKAVFFSKYIPSEDES